VTSKKWRLDKRRGCSDSCTTKANISSTAAENPRTRCCEDETFAKGGNVIRHARKVLSCIVCRMGRNGESSEVITLASMLLMMQLLCSNPKHSKKYSCLNQLMEDFVCRVILQD